MKARMIFVFLLAGFTQTAHSQQFIERVYLKDSSFYEGYIIEQVPQQYLKVDRVKLKDTVTVPLSLVWKITKSYYKDSAALKKTAAAKPEKLSYLKTAFVEFFGNAGLYSLNFDMRTEKGRRDRWGFRVGYENFNFSAKDTGTGEGVTLKLAAVPFGINYLFGKRKGFLELGAGATYFIIKLNGKILSNSEIEGYQADIFNENISTVVGTFNIGYRHVPYGSGIMYRFVISPLVITNKIIPFFGSSLGYKF
jgi:hypothetical protein